MGNPFKFMDEIFELFIQDSFGRFVCLHLPFWSVLYAITWQLLANLGPFILLSLIFSVLTPLFFATIYFTLYESEGNFKPFKIAIPIGLGVLILVVGIPHVFFGIFFDIFCNKTALKLYGNSIRYWWAFLNHLQPFKNQWPTTDEYDFKFQTVQWILWGTALIVTPIFFNFLYTRDKTEKEKQRKEIELRETEEEKKKSRQKILGVGRKNMTKSSDKSR